MSIGLAALLGLLVILVNVAVVRRQDAAPVVKRFAEQFAKLVPRMLCALVGAGFVATLIPKQLIAGPLGPDAGLLALPVAAAAGLMVPSGPVISFAIAAVFAKAGASTPALITFLTSWSIFAVHRILIFELPLVGASFFRLRIASVAVIPFIAGVLAMLVGLITTFGQAAP
ncbi:MAG: hypothetical protein GKR99_07060 [Rhodobacteraceae bacterium]|nr:hypothetical protein [Paracoccaceae bacterium]